MTGRRGPSERPDEVVWCLVSAVLGDPVVLRRDEPMVVGSRAETLVIVWNVGHGGHLPS